jgi:O-acetyl-ADP-ribose deacetylase (regulator of RNase III)
MTNENININYVTGDATKPFGLDNKLILHICNDVNGWGAGFVNAISKRWTLPEKTYRGLFKQNNKEILGTIQKVSVEEDIAVVNMIAQHGFSKPGFPAIRYDALRQCLEKVRDDIGIDSNQTSIHMPRIGCGLAGGKWEIVEEIIKIVFNNTSYKIYVYDL